MSICRKMYKMEIVQRTNQDANLYQRHFTEHFKIQQWIHITILYTDKLITVILIFKIELTNYTFISFIFKSHVMNYNIINPQIITETNIKCLQKYPLSSVFVFT